MVLPNFNLRAFEILSVQINKIMGFLPPRNH